MNRYLHITTALLILLTTACSHIDEDERYNYIKPSQADRVVLLEDFTGQRCVNCPRGTEVIEALQKEFGEDKVIAVGIHGGPLGFAGSATVKGLATSIGDEYYNHWKLEYQPVGLIDRHGAVNYTDWTREVVAELSKPSPIQLFTTCDIDESGDLDITVDAMGTDGNINGYLQVWVIEDGITALQMMPDGSSNREYVHNHVLRTPVNGTWGEAITVKEGEFTQVSLKQKTDPEWNLHKVSIVAFIYNDSGVLQASRTYPIAEEPAQ